MALTKIAPTLPPSRSALATATQAGSAATVRGRQPVRDHHPAFPAHVERFLVLLREGTSWPAKSWDDETDTIAYGRIVLQLSREQVRELYYRLRERYTFRPSVAEVSACLDAIMEEIAPRAGEAAHLRYEMSPTTAARILADPKSSEANLAIARRVMPHLALASTGEGIGRARSREILNNLRRRSGLPERESAAPTAKYSPSTSEMEDI